MKRSSLFFLALLAGLLGGFLAVKFIPNNLASNKESAYERVMRTNTLRCGYNTWAPFFKLNDETGKPEGFMVELMEEIGKHANIKIEWAAQLDWGTIPADLATGKADTFCAAVYANASRARAMLFGDVIGRQYLEPFVRADDNRFTGTAEEAFNRPEIRIVGWEGTPTLVQTNLRFPKAQKVMMSSMEGTTGAYANLINNKGDVFFSSMADASGFMKNNPGKIKRLDRKYNLGSQSLTVNTASGEHDLLNFLNTALGELHNDGTFDRLYQKYNAISPEFMEPAQ